MKVLVVEDDSLVGPALLRLLERDGFAATLCRTGRDASEFAATYSYDAILLDLGLPDMNGRDFLRNLRAKKDLTPVLVLTGRNYLHELVGCFDSGADDFIGKPFHRSELVARLTAVIRRARGFSSTRISCGGLSLDLTAKKAVLAGREVPLTRKQYAILEMLMLRQETTVSRQELLDRLYEGGDEDPYPKIIDIYVSQIRKRLRQAAPGFAGIQTLRNEGYKLTARGCGPTPLDKGGC